MFQLLTCFTARRPFYTLIRCYHRFFLFCMEPATDNSYDIGLWIRRVSNKENKEEENGPCFTYNFVMMKNSGKSKVRNLVSTFSFAMISKLYSSDYFMFFLDADLLQEKLHFMA